MTSSPATLPSRVIPLKPISSIASSPVCSDRETDMTNNEMDKYHDIHFPAPEVPTSKHFRSCSSHVSVVPSNSLITSPWKAHCAMTKI